MFEYLDNIPGKSYEMYSVLPQSPAGDPDTGAEWE